MQGEICRSIHPVEENGVCSLCNETANLPDGKPTNMVRNVCAWAHRLAKIFFTILRVWRCSFMLVECYTTRGFAIYASVLARFTMIARIAARLNCARIAQCDSHEAGAKLEYQ